MQDSPKNRIIHKREDNVVAVAVFVVVVVVFVKPNLEFGKLIKPFKKIMHSSWDKKTVIVVVDITAVVVVVVNPGFEDFPRCNHSVKSTKKFFFFRQKIEAK